jgi:hypothetical protein
MNSFFQPGMNHMASDLGFQYVATNRIPAAWTEFENEIFSVVGQAIDRMLEDAELTLVDEDATPTAC